MARLVIASNRVSIPRRGAKAGGLAVALRDTLARRGGVWFGWSGDIVELPSSIPKSTVFDGVSTVTVDLSQQDYDAFYNGFCNSTLWPLFHYRLGLLEVSRKNYEGYLRVNANFATALAPLLRPDDVIWIHDYHLIPLGEELRQRGITNRIGFFLHTPFPVPEVLVALPGHRRLIEALCAYNLIGFQTDNDVRAFLSYLTTETQTEIQTDGLCVTSKGRKFTAAAFPIGIDTDTFARLAALQGDAAETQRLRSSLRGRKLALGVERLDYSKGLPQRLEAVEGLLEDHPELRGKFEFMQIAAPSREDVSRYRSLRRQLEGIAGRINGHYAECDWQPIRYLNKNYDRKVLAGFYRAAAVGVVTPLRDGMNLVAKEYVAAQNPADPGVLVLSRFAGAARELTEALIVNPYDVAELTEAMARALVMPKEERIERWQAMMEVIESCTVEVWRDRFLGML